MRKRSRRKAQRDVGPDFFPKHREEVRSWKTVEWLLVERALRRLRVRPADQARKEALLRGVNGKLCDLGEIMFER